MKVKILTPDHIDETIRLLSHLNAAVPEEILRQRYEEIITNYPNYSMVGAYVNSKLVGLSGVWHGMKIWCGPYMEVDNLVVHPDYRGRGVGSALLEYIEAMAREKKCHVMTLDSYATNHPSHRLYIKQGYEMWSFHFVKPLQDFAH
jgi:GNAT superfamily N-acetyltransferase